MTTGPKRVAVTGAGGMIGIEVCRQLVDAGHIVHAYDLGEQIARVKHVLPEAAHVYYGSILDPAALHDAFAGCDLVIHLAALLGVRRSETERLRGIITNVDGTRSVLEAAVMNRVGKVVFASSSEVYGEPIDNPVTEESVTQGKTVYAVTKLMGEELCRAYTQSFGLRHTILRFFNTFGPYQAGEFVISRFVQAVAAGERPIVNGAGDQIRSFTYVADAARGVLLAAFDDATDGEVINLGAGANATTMLDLARLVISVGGRSGEIEPDLVGSFDGTDRTEHREIFVRMCSGEKAKRLLGWEPEISLEEGVRRVFEAGVIFPSWENLGRVLRR